MIAMLINLVVYLLVVGLILWLLIYLVDTLPLFSPYKQVARTVIMVFGVIILILLLLGLLGAVDVGMPRIVH